MRQPYYWWLVTFSAKGQLVVLGKYELESEAIRFGVTNLGGNFQVFELDTADRRVATQRIKYKLLEKTGDLERALQRARHKI